jgi:integrase
MTRLEQSLADYLQLRRSLGHQLADAGRLLPAFVTFLDELGLSTVTVSAAMEWATLPAADPRSTVGPRRMTAVRGFARFLAGVDPATEVPPLGLLPQQTRWRGPFVFSQADIDLIMNRVGVLTPALRSATYVTLIGLLAATGLRIGEAIKLDRADVDWSAGLLLIRESKFGNPAWSQYRTRRCTRWPITPAFAISCSVGCGSRASSPPALGTGCATQRYRRRSGM